MNNGDYGQTQADYAVAMAAAEGLGNRLYMARIHNCLGIIANHTESA